MAITLKEYKWVFETGNDPDVTELNQAAAEGWEFVYGGSRTSGSGQTQWGYLMQRSAGQSETDVLVGTFTVGTSDNRITIPDHGLLSTDMVRFALGTEPINELPAPLVEGVYYFLVGLRGNDFQVSLISGGMAVDLTSQGVGGTNQVWKK